MTHWIKLKSPIATIMVWPPPPPSLPPPSHISPLSSVLFSQITPSCAFLCQGHHTYSHSLRGCSSQGHRSVFLITQVSAQVSPLRERPLLKSQGKSYVLNSDTFSLITVYNLFLSSRLLLFGMMFIGMFISLTSLSHHILSSLWAEIIPVLFTNEYPAPNLMPGLW